mgnify:CR=1 FL=1
MSHFHQGSGKSVDNALHNEIAGLSLVDIIVAGEVVVEDIVILQHALVADHHRVSVERAHGRTFALLHHLHHDVVFQLDRKSVV